MDQQDFSVRSVPFVHPDEMLGADEDDRMARRGERDWPPDRMAPFQVVCVREPECAEVLRRSQRQAGDALGQRGTVRRLEFVEEAGAGRMGEAFLGSRERRLDDIPGPPLNEYAIPVNAGGPEAGAEP